MEASGAGTEDPRSGRLRKTPGRKPLARISLPLRSCKDCGGALASDESQSLRGPRSQVPTPVAEISPRERYSATVGVFYAPGGDEAERSVKASMLSTHRSVLSVFHPAPGDLRPSPSSPVRPGRAGRLARPASSRFRRRCCVVVAGGGALVREADSHDPLPRENRDRVRALHSRRWQPRALAPRSGCRAGGRMDGRIG